jgi:hypothetical protein
MRRYLPFVILGGVFLLGCADKSTTPTSTNSSTTQVAGATTVPPKHAGWWCKEHGIPEAECLMCLHDEGELKKMKNWCEIHEYAKSQCFGCDPKLKERYAAQYRAKYPGKEPPEPEDNPPTKNPKK